VEADILISISIEISSRDCGPADDWKCDSKRESVGHPSIGQSFYRWFGARKRDGYTSAGMQELVNALRNAGASTQPTLLDRLAYAGDFFQFLAFMPADSANAIPGLNNYPTYRCDTSCLSSTVDPLSTAGEYGRGYVLGGCPEPANIVSSVGLVRR
jgi:hypothetical protein